MKVYFRELLKEHIPTIMEISKEIWEGEDYIPTVIEGWLSEENSYNYGAFLDKEFQELVGFGRVNFLSDIAWLEGGRVKKSLQQKGIGRQLMEHAIKYARNKGSKLAQYDTSSENEGSLALADYFGFKKKDEMYFLHMYPKEKEINFESFKIQSEIKKIGYDEIIAKYKEIENGPINELNTGWSFIPLNKKFLKIKEGIWYATSKAILQVEKQLWKVIEKDDIKELKLIVYGDKVEASDLIKFIVIKYLKEEQYDEVSLFCRFKIVEEAKNLGFSYPDYPEIDKNESVKVILFEKELKPEN
ncbi:MAG: GNAT family N-acetyltransferase [Candidatus Lokiarchaeota archaeon]